MNMHLEKTARGFAEAGEAEAALRAIAGLPAPAGLEDRVKAALQREPAGRSAKLLDWPVGSWVRKPWAARCGGCGDCDCGGRRKLGRVFAGAAQGGADCASAWRGSGRILERECGAHTEDAGCSHGDA